MDKRGIFKVNVRYGACFQRNGDKFLDLLGLDFKADVSHIRLVHGVIAPANEPDRQFAYCWIEVGTEVVDFTSGSEVRVPIAEWNVSWCVHQRFVYAGRVGAKKLADEGGWGPWDFRDPKPNLALPDRAGSFNPQMLNALINKATMLQDLAHKASMDASKLPRSRTGTNLGRSESETRSFWLNMR
jgi:hypothetical protein